MDYNEFASICKEKGFAIGDAAKQINYTRQGLQIALNNGTIDLKRLKLLCKLLEISPMEFFDDFDFISEKPDLQNNFKIILERKDVEIMFLKEKVSDQKEIIKLLREVNGNGKNNYLIASEPK